MEEKPKEIKQIFKFSNKSPQGIIIIKNIIQTANKEQKAEISYLAVGKYSFSITGKEFKEGKTKSNSTKY